MLHEELSAAAQEPGTSEAQQRQGARLGDGDDIARQSDFRNREVIVIAVDSDGVEFHAIGETCPQVGPQVVRGSPCVRSIVPGDRMNDRPRSSTREKVNVVVVIAIRAAAGSPIEIKLQIRTVSPGDFSNLPKNGILVPLMEMRRTTPNRGRQDRCWIARVIGEGI